MAVTIPLYSDIPLIILITVLKQSNQMWSLRHSRINSD